MMARLYLLLYRLLKALIFHLDTLFVGTALGFLTRRQWHAVDERLYLRTPEYQSETHNLGGLFGWETEAIENYFGACRHLLVVGAGGGREVLALAGRGHDVVGYECNPALVAYAQRLLREQGNAGQVEYLARDGAPPPPDVPFDGIIVGWSAYMLIIGRENRIAFLRDLGAQMTAGAPLLTSFWTREGDSRRLVRVARLANLGRKLLRRPRVEVGDDVAPNAVHRFTRAEIEAELGEAGFALAHFRPQGTGNTESGYAVGHFMPK